MKCAHEQCTCRVEAAGGFCSQPCGLGTQTGPFCGCGHANCESSPVGVDAVIDGEAL
jgi:hypothetical protein